MAKCCNRYRINHNSNGIDYRPCSGNRDVSCFLRCRFWDMYHPLCHLKSILVIFAALLSKRLYGWSKVWSLEAPSIQSKTYRQGGVEGFMSVNSMFINSSTNWVSLKAGLLAKSMGTVTSVVFGGCMTLAVVVFTWFKAPSLRKMEYWIGYGSLIIISTNSWFFFT